MTPDDETIQPDTLHPDTLERLQQSAQQAGISMDAMLNHLLNEGTRLLVEHITDIVSLHTTEGRYVYLSPSVLTAIGYTPQEMLGKRGVDFIHHDDIPILRKGYKEVMTHGISRMEYRAIHKDGHEFWVETINHALYDPQTGAVMQIIAVSRDITERKTADYLIHQNEQKYRQLFQEAPIAIWKQDLSVMKRYLDGLIEGGITNIEAYLRENPQIVRACLRLVRIVDANSIALKLYGATTISDVQARFDELIDASTAQPASLAAIAHGERHFSGEFINQTLDGQTLHLLLKWIVMEGHETTYDEVLVATIDITEQKHYEVAMRENERLIAQFRAQQAHESFIQHSIAALSHDLRTPLSVIATSKDLLLRYFDKLTEERRKEKLETIGRQLEFALELLDDTVLMIGGKLNERPFRPMPLDLAQLCRVSVDELGASQNAKHRLNFVNNGDMRLVMADEVLISRILINLLTNALKYSPPNSPVRLVLDNDDAHIILQVIDEGIGIAPEALARIFEPFYRADNAQGIQGTGLGMPIVKACVTQHRGQIHIDSTIGKGTTITITLPLERVPEIGTD